MRDLPPVDHETADALDFEYQTRAGALFFCRFRWWLCSLLCKQDLPVCLDYGSQRTLEEARTAAVQRQ